MPVISCFLHNVLLIALLEIKLMRELTTKNAFNKLVHNIRLKERREYPAVYTAMVHPAPSDCMCNKL